jgi:hypothetical protein
MPNGLAVTESLRRRYADLPPPVIVFCKSHSGSRLLARLMMAGGIWLGALRNDSEDSAQFLQLVEPLVKAYHPDWSRFFTQNADEVEALAIQVIDTHLVHRPKDAPWGWKLCETGYILPFVHRVFPQARFVHLLRDGRDVAFCDHVAPRTPFWSKVYFDTDQISAWQGRGLSNRAYQRAPHIYNAQHWVNSVRLGRSYGAMLGAQYIELRYEDMVSAPLRFATELMRRLGIACHPEAFAPLLQTVRQDSLGKYRQESPRRVRQAMAVLRPMLEACGYGLEAPEQHNLWRKVGMHFYA